MRHLGESEKRRKRREEKKKKKIRFPIYTITYTLPLGESSHFQGHRAQLPVNTTRGLGHLGERSGTIQIHMALLGPREATPAGHRVQHTARPSEP